MTIQMYGLECPIELTIRYVGKSVCPNTRFSRHIYSAKRGATDHHTARWIRMLLSMGLRPRLVILCDVAEGERWQDVERRLIAEAPARGWRLTNSTRGGEGLDYALEEDRQRYLANLAAAMEAVRATQEWRDKVSEANIASWADAEIRALRIAGMAVANQHPEVMALRSAVITEINARPEIKAAQVERLTAEWSDPILGPQRRAAIQGASGKMSVSAQARWADPIKREEGLAAVKSEAKRAKNRVALLARVTPEYRAAQAEGARKSWEKRNRSVGPPSAETREKISAALSGRPHSAERKAAISAAQTGKKRGPHSPAHRAALGAAISATKQEKKANAQGDLL